MASPSLLKALPAPSKAALGQECEQERCQLNELPTARAVAVANQVVGEVQSRANPESPLGGRRCRRFRADRFIANERLHIFTKRFGQTLKRGATNSCC